MCLSAADLDHILARTERLWEELRGGCLCLMDGNGFFGCWLRQTLPWANDQPGGNAQAVLLSRSPAVRTYHYGAELAVWLWKILFRGASNRPCDLGSNIPVSVTELARAAVRVLLRSSPDTRWTPTRPPSPGLSEPGLGMSVPLSTASQRTLARHREDLTQN